jgi:putative transposase
MKLRYRYRFYPTTEQQTNLAKAFGCARVVWNDALALCQKSEKLPKNSELQKICITQAKKSEERTWLSEVSNILLQQSVADLGVAFSNFFNSLKGKRKGPKVRSPKFKRKQGRQSIRLTRGGFSIKDQKVYLAKIGEVKVHWSRELPCEPSSVTVIKDAANRYFLSFIVEKDLALLPTVGSSIGIDLGITTFATLSTGEKIDAPKPLKKNLKKLARLQKALSRCQKGSNRRKVAKLKVAKIHARIADIRNDFLHKLSSRLIFENQEISLEDLNVSGMMKNRKLSKAISDLGWRTFRTMLEAKALMYGREVNVISRWEPTSQTCSDCGFKGGRKELNVREWQCLNCGAFHDRDINAAINIKKVAGGHSETKNGRCRKCKTFVEKAISVESVNLGNPIQLTLWGV